MKPSNLSYSLMLVFILLSLAACGPITPTPGVPVKPQPDSVGTPTGAPGTPGVTLSSPTVTPIRTPSNTSVPTDTPVPTETPTITSTPTETPQPTVVNTPAPGPTIIVEAGTGVGRDQYNTALAKWRSQSIQEYVMVIEYVSLAPFAGTWTLKVSGEAIEVISYSRDGAVPATPPAGVVGDALKFLTVEDRFALIETRLTDAEVSNLDKRVNYVVEYDEALGYPSLLDIIEADPKLQDQQNKTSVKSLTIIRRGTPQPQEPTVTPTTTGATPTAPPAASPAAPKETAVPRPTIQPATSTIATPAPTTIPTP
jgi:hypothetical protein